MKSWHVIGIAVLIVFALVVASGQASAAPKGISGKNGCAIAAQLCSQMIQNRRMYDDAFNADDNTMYDWAIRRVTTRLQNWLPRYAASIQDCVRPDHAVRPIIRNVKTEFGVYHVLASPQAGPGDVCYIRKTKR